MILRKAFFITALFISTACAAQHFKIIPEPVEITGVDPVHPFVLTKKTKIVLLHGNGLEKHADYFNNYLQDNYGFKLMVVKQTSQSQTNAIYIGYSPLPTTDTIKDKYTLTVTPEHISLTSRGGPALFYGFQTLIQLLPPAKQKSLLISQVKIVDYPRFQYRGMHLDVSRHFFPVSFVKKYIDYLALHKLNRFHWHLTDDQGWRIEIKKYPLLTSVGGWRNGTIIGRYPGTGNDGLHYGGFYTQEEIKEVVRYAAERYIEVIPEIEMPGHASAAIAAYPELSCFPSRQTGYPTQCAWAGPKDGKQVQQTWGVFDDVFCAGKENTFNFLEDVMKEVLELFPSKYIHVGGDECPKTHWKECPSCKQRMTENNLKNEHELQSYFIQRMEKYLNKNGRKLIGWDEILEGGLAPNAAVMSWQGEKGGIEAAKQNHDVVMTPGSPVYFDHTQSENDDSVTFGGFNPIEKVYAYEPVPKELTGDEAKHILGAQANCWTEYMTNTSKVEYMIFPRMAALSEILWSPKEKRSWDGFEERLQQQFKRYDLWKANYSRAYFELKTSVEPLPGRHGVQWVIDQRPGMNVSLLMEQRVKVNVPDTVAVYDTKDPTKLKSWKIYKAGDTAFSMYPVPATKPARISIVNPGTYRLSSFMSDPDFQQPFRTMKEKALQTIQQTFQINKATGHEIKLTVPASNKYPGEGPFTLVNGIINEKGYARTKEYLGFSGTDCEAIIDLESIQEISFVVIHALNRTTSWIWRPASVELSGSGDGQNWYPLKQTDVFEEKKNGNGIGTMTLAFRKSPVRYLKVNIKNWGTIPEGNAGAGSKAWLFVDEIEVE